MCLFYIIDSFGSEFRFRTLGEAKAAMERHGCSEVYWRNPRFDSSRKFRVDPMFLEEDWGFLDKDAEYWGGEIPSICDEL